MSKYRYREVKNYIHNELKLTKEDIKDIIVSIVKEEVKRIFHNTYGDDVNIERWIRCMVSDEIKKKRKIQKRPFLYNVGQVFKACDWLTEIQRGNIVWHRYHLFGTITKRYV